VFSSAKNIKSFHVIVTLDKIKIGTIMILELRIAGQNFFYSSLE